MSEESFENDGLMPEIEAAEEVEEKDSAAEKTERDKSKLYCFGLVSRHTLKVIWGTILVTLINFGYFTGGYYAFQHFQAEYFEKEARDNEVLLEEKTELFLSVPGLNDPAVQENYTKIADLLCTITKYPRPRWSFWAAFDFCVSIVTTVGYGSLSPSTWYSKALTLVYSMAGLPLYLIMLGAAGKYIVGMFEYMNEKSAVIQRVCTHRYTELIVAYINIAIIMTLFLFGYSYFGYDASRAVKEFPNATYVLDLPGYGYEYTANRINGTAENWSQLVSVYYAMISLTTIGFGEFYLGNPENPKQAAMLFLSISFGFALFSYAFQTYAKLSEETMKYLKNKTGKLTAAAANAAQAELVNMVDKIPSQTSPTSDV